MPQAEPGEAARPLPTASAAFSAAASNCGVQQGVQLLGLDAEHSGLLVDHALVNQIAGDLYVYLFARCACRTGLQHEEHAILDGELHILHIAVVSLEAAGDLDELVVDLGHLLMQLADRGGGADAGDDVLDPAH